VLVLAVVVLCSGWVLVHGVDAEFSDCSLPRELPLNQIEARTNRQPRPIQCTGLLVLPFRYPLASQLVTVENFLMRGLNAFVVGCVGEIAARRGRTEVARFLGIGAQWPAAGGRR
jgi:hypothetical protein